MRKRGQVTATLSRPRKLFPFTCRVALRTRNHAKTQLVRFHEIVLGDAE
jgi:hypothetical protein